MNFKYGLSVFIIFALATFSVFPAHHTDDESGDAEEPSLSLDLHARTAILINAGIFDPMLEIEGSLQGPEYGLGYAALTLGSYIRPHKNLKLGLFYRLQQGVRHDDDWIWEDGAWTWEENIGRFEHLLIADLSPRFLLSFLPGKNWVLMTKLRYIFNTFNLHHSLYFRPGLTYFLMSNRQPLVNISLNYGFYVPLNFGETFIYEHEPYLHALFHVNSFLKLETTFAFKTVIWSTSSDTIDRGGETYALPVRSFLLGLGVVFTL